MSALTQFPAALQTFLAAHGQPVEITALSGLSDAAVWRVQFAVGSLIVKRTTRANELAFYRQVAPALRDHAIPIPQLAWSVEDAAAHWLVLEDIPQEFPAARWLADQEQLTVLRRLHQLPIAWELSTQFRPGWNDAMTEKACRWFAADRTIAIEGRLARLQSMAQPLFKPRCPISGDPNPRNWGLREDRTLVLFDWERFGYATPALDVAVTLPWLAEPAAIQRQTAAYLLTDDASQIAAFGREIALAKVWTVVEFLSIAHDLAVAPSTMDELLKQFPIWIARLATLVE